MKQYKLVQAHQDNFAKTSRDLGKVCYIVIHYTANKNDTAAGNCKYFKNNVTKSSAHFFVDGKEILQSVPLSHAAWHCGGKLLSGTQGGTYNGKCTNTNSIGIELCGTGSTKTEILPNQATIDMAIELTKELMAEFNIPAENVIRHFDVTWKQCPAYWVDDKKWNSEFKSKLVEKKEVEKVVILDETTRNPLQKIGKMAGICWNSEDNLEKNITRGKDCILSGHGRTMEFVDIEVVLSGWSARAIRELYTHIGGSPTRLQESTRYVNCAEFDYFTPPMKPDQEEIYDQVMNQIKEGYKKLMELGVSKEDAANVLPLGMSTKIIWKCNLRMLENFMNQRLCGRAYHEIHRLAYELKKALGALDDEWKWISDNLFVPKCEKTGYCIERKSCGRKPKKA